MEAGQLVMTGVSGFTLTEDEKDFIQSENIGGVIIFAHNYNDPAQLAELINAIQNLRDEHPLFIAIDNEGGRVFRTRKHLTQIPAMLELSKLDSPKVVYDVHRIMAEELKLCGVNVDFAPCADILTNPANKVIGDRSFGSDPDVVEKYVSAAIRGLQTHGVMACAKHFPGHGGTTKDSHFDLPHVKTSRAELIEKELIPFVKASKARVEFMMMAHLQVDSIDPMLPTSLSAKAYEFLRKETKFTKIVVTDDMEMKAITDRFPTEEAAVMALEAGADIVEYRSMSEAKRGLNGIKNAIKTKRLLNTQITEKLERVLDCKKRNLADYKPVYIPELQNKFNTPESKAILKEITDKLTQE
ncbi:MAG: beta-N-acetylhexosaminidase [Bacteriovoracaceae bacterium]